MLSRQDFLVESVVHVVVSLVLEEALECILQLSVVKLITTLVDDVGKCFQHLWICLHRVDQRFDVLMAGRKVDVVEHLVGQWIAQLGEFQRLPLET